MTSHDIKDGIYPGVSMEDYQAWPFASRSALTVLALGGTPAHYRASMVYHTRSNKSMTIGTIAHAALLEPELFQKYRVLPDTVRQRRGKDYEQLCADNPGVEWVTPSEWVSVGEQKCRAELIRENALRHPLVADMLERATHREVSVVTTDHITHMRYKIRPDIAAPDFLADVKTHSKKTPYDAARSGYNFGLHIQSAMYSDGWTRETGGKPDMNPIPFWFIFIESEPPHLVTVHNGHAAYDERNQEVSPTAYLELGREQYRNALRQVRDCEQTGIWPGHPTEVLDMAIPRFAGMEGWYQMEKTGGML